MSINTQGILATDNRRDLIIPKEKKEPILGFHLQKSPLNQPATPFESDDLPFNYDPLGKVDFVKSTISPPQQSNPPQEAQPLTTTPTQRHCCWRCPRLLSRLLHKCLRKKPPVPTKTDLNIKITPQINVDPRIELLHNFFKNYFPTSTINDKEITELATLTQDTVDLAIERNTPLSNRFKQIVFYQEKEISIGQKMKTPIVILMLNKTQQYGDPQLGSIPMRKKVRYGFSVPFKNPKDPISSLYIVTTGPSYPQYFGNTMLNNGLQARKDEVALLQELSAIKGVVTPCAIPIQAKSTKCDLDRIYLLFPYFNLGDLYTYIENRHFFPSPDHLPHENRDNDWNIAIQCIESAIELHKTQASLNDLKPENIFLKLGTSNIIEIGFGDLEQKHQATAPTFTPAYAPPEGFQIDSFIYPGDLSNNGLCQNPEEARVVWLLGCVFYLLLLGQKLPWEHKQATPNSINKLKFNPTNILDSLIQKMLSAIPENRPTLKKARIDLLTAYYAYNTTLSTELPNKEISITKKNQ